MKKMDLKTKDPSLDINSDPSGTNNSTTLASYYQKKLYEVRAFSHPLYSDNKPINITYEKQYYGRVNLAHVAVITDSVRMKSMNDGKGNEIKFQNFVFDAYRDFISYWDYLKKINKVSKSGIIQTVNAKYASLNAGRMYFYYMSSLFSKVNKMIVNNQVTIKSLNDFANEFINYVDEVSPSIPLNFSSYVGSRMADPLISGLCFDVNSLDSSDDAAKYSTFLLDPNYALFKKTAMKFGFFPDKQVPWRLWADIDSPAMKPYMDSYQLTQDNIYDLNYITADSYDLELIRFYILQFYNTYITTSKLVREPNFKICEKSGSTIVNYKEFNLDFIKSEDVLKQEYDHFFMKMYVYVKARENNYSWDKTKFDHIVSNFIQIKEALDLKAAMKYLVPLVKVPAASDRKQRNFRFY